MKEGRPLPELAAEVARQANAKRDFLAPAQALRLNTNGHSALNLAGNGNVSYELNDIAHGQVAQYLDIPKAFYDRMRGGSEDLRVPLLDEEYDPAQDDYPLFDVLINTLLDSKGEDCRLIRTLDGKARAFLSDSFSVDLDNYDVLRVAATVIEEAGLGPDNVVSAEVTERKLYVKVVSPKLEAVIRPENLTGAHGGHHFLKEPQIVQAGFIIANSEVGLGALSVQQTVFKLMCTNLWVMETVCRQRHLGKALEAGDDGAVFGLLLDGAQKHLSKIRKEHPAPEGRSGPADFAHNRISDILGCVDQFPKTLALGSQAYFSLGYYHHRAAKRAAIADAGARIADALIDDEVLPGDDNGI